MIGLSEEILMDLFAVMSRRSGPTSSLLLLDASCGLLRNIMSSNKSKSVWDGIKELAAVKTKRQKRSSRINVVACSSDELCSERRFPSSAGQTTTRW